MEHFGNPLKHFGNPLKHFGNASGFLDSVGSNKLIDVNIEYLALSNNLLPQTKRERDAEEAAAVRERDKLQSQAKKKEETKLCW